MIVDCNRQYLFGQFLANDVLVQNLTNFVRCRKLVLIGASGVGGGAFFPNDVVTKLDALIADEHRWPGNELPHLVLAFAAEGTVKKLIAGCFLGHSFSSGRARSRSSRLISVLLYPAWARLCKTLSTIPYETACSDVRNRSRS